MGSRGGQNRQQGKAISVSEDAETCMCLGTQLNALYSALKEDDGQASRRAFHAPLLINFLVGDGWRDGVYALKAESADVSTYNIRIRATNDCSNLFCS